MKLPRARWHRVTWVVTSIWIVLLVAALAAQSVLPNPRWYLIHIAGLGVISSSILIWTWHFADALTRRKQSQARQLIRLGMLGVGMVLLAVALGISGAQGALCALAGAALILSGFTWHALALRRALRSEFASAGAVTLRYHFAGVALFVFGALLGLIMTIDVTERQWAVAWWPVLYSHHDGMAIAHAAAMAIGFVGMTVLGTLVTFGPTVARTRMTPGGIGRAVRAMPWLVGAIVVAALAAVFGFPSVTGLGVILWVVMGAGGVLLPVLSAWRGSMLAVGDGWFMGAGICWMELAALLWGWQLLNADSAAAARNVAGGVYALLLAAGALQLILGSLTYLLPVVVGGGPARVRATIERIEPSAGARWLLLNGAVLLALIVGEGRLQSLCLGLAVVTALASFLLLLTTVLRQRNREIREAAPVYTGGPIPMPDPRLRTGAVLAVVALSVTTAVGVSLAATDRPAGVGAATTTQTGETTRVEVTVEGMAFVPDTITVPQGNRLEITLRNTGDQRHDLVLESGETTGPLAVGEAATITTGPITANTQGWCSMVGHRQMGMTLDIVTGAPSSSEHTHHQADGGADGTNTTPTTAQLQADPGEDFSAYEAKLEPAGVETTHHIQLEAREVEREVAPGRTQTAWTFNGTTPGPILRGRVGDTFVITLTNSGSMGHSIDFHAGDVTPDDNMRTIDPGESLTYTFTAKRAGIWLYHCSTAPMSVHIANGMFGAVIIDPAEGLDEVDEEYVLIQSEQYWSDDLSVGTDATKVVTVQPDVVTFNGYPFQYDHAPLSAATGDRVRIWVLDAGPNLDLSFHIVGTQFDTVWSEGTYSLRRGCSNDAALTGVDCDPQAGGDSAAQVLPLQAAQGGFVEFVPVEAGHYSIVNHAMSYAERGAHGTLEVTD